MSIASQGLARWMAYIDGGHDRAELAAMLAEDAVFHSPVVHTPQQGREKCLAYLGAAGHVFSDSAFRYVRTIAEEDSAMLEFTAEMDGIFINGIDLIRWNAAGKIVDFKVMVRPLKAINLLWKMMGDQLARQAA